MARNHSRAAGFDTRPAFAVLLMPLILPELLVMPIRCTEVIRRVAPGLVVVTLVARSAVGQHSSAPIPLVPVPQSPTTAETPADANWGELALFNGRDFDGLHVFVDDAAMKVSDVCTLADGAICVSGKGKGYVRTTSAYADYKLSLEWRWPSGGGNSGLLIHLVNPDVIWPKGFEVQLATGRAGDLSSYADARSKEELVSRNPTGYSTGRLARKAQADVEKPLGEWNLLEVLAIGDELVVSVNGVEVNRMSGAVPSAGMIGLQAEGTAIDFRNVMLTPLAPRKDLHAPMPKR